MESLFVSIPHAGEIIPAQVQWLKGLPEPILMRDVDRYVDQLYKPVISALKIPNVVADCHRYVIDLNRTPAEYDADAVLGAPWPAGTHPKGLHWSVTTFGEKLIPQPMSMDVHQQLVTHFYEPFHKQVRDTATRLKKQNGVLYDVFHIDLHSMPSQGTGLHNDPGQTRADIVVSDFHGKSSRKDFVDLIMDAYKKAGFSVAYNWPYFGGGITQLYGKPDNHHHTVQVELNRSLYMDENSKAKLAGGFEVTQARLSMAMEIIAEGLRDIE